MIWFLLLAVVVIIAVVAVQAARRGAHAEPALSPEDPPAVRDSTRPATAAPPSRPDPPRPDNVLQPHSPIPLTVEGTTPQAVAPLRTILEDEHVHGRERQERLLEWLLITNGRVTEIDAFITEWGPKFTAAVSKLSAADPDWASAGELDREDIRDGARRKALERFEVRVADLDYEAIAEPPSIAATADDELLSRFGFESLSFYFRHAGDLERVHVVPSDDWYRPRFEALVATGLAKRGADVAPTAVLQTLTLKEMEALAEGVEHKRFTRRAPAVEFLSGLPDIRERIGRRVSLRELFQLFPLPSEFAHLDLMALGRAWAYAAEYAKLLDLTHSTAARAQEAIAQATNDEHAKGWRVEGSWGETPCCPFCAREAGERRGVRNPPRLPHHVGCTCHLSQIYESQ